MRPVRPRHIRLRGRTSETEKSKMHMVQVQSMKSSFKSVAAYEVRLLCNAVEVLEHHCTCGSGARAFPCAHTAAVMIEIACLHDVPEPTCGEKSMQELATAVSKPYDK